VPGVGVWTCAEVAQRALGDPDSVSFGDYHVAKNITWALTGEALDDDALAELLEPYAGHRYRVQRLLELDHPVRPRRGPRMAPRTHLPTRR
jgi:3-methyladenine DNA glycosylase/8-oxoguanine DNA glycosylase